jgi:hypothetical protein
MVYDLGSGDGRLVTAAEKYCASGIGIDIDLNASPGGKMRKWW